MRRLGCAPAVVDTALARLRSLNYLNDDAFALNWAGARARNRGYGPRRIEQELRAKGIAPSTARRVLGEVFAQEDENALAQRLLAKRFKSQDLKDVAVQRRAAALLERRGFSAKVIFELLKYNIDEN